MAYKRLSQDGMKRQDRPRKKGVSVKLMTLFQSHAASFQSATVMMYDKEETLSYYTLDLLWGNELYQELRFVRVKMGNRLSILASTDLALAATGIICLYGYRFKIECTFREMKQQMGGFSYHFWSKSMPKLNRYLKKDQAQPLEHVKVEKDRTNIQRTIKALKVM